MDTRVIINPAAASGKLHDLEHQQQLRAQLTDVLGNCEFVYTQAPGHAQELTAAALSNGTQQIVTVGGDGSLQEVLQGFFRASGEPTRSPSTFSFVPFGTGNDFARACGWDLKKELAPQLHAASTRAIDIGRVTSQTDTGGIMQRYFLNIASAGFSGYVAQQTSRGSRLKVLGPKIGYFIATLQGFACYKNLEMSVSIDDQHWWRGLANSVVIANGSSFGGGMRIAPNAVLDDGSFDVVVIGDVGVATFIRHSGKIYSGNYQDLDHFHCSSARNITLTPHTSTPVAIEAGGEFCGFLPATFEILPQALTVAAPWGTA